MGDGEENLTKGSGEPQYIWMLSHSWAGYYTTFSHALWHVLNVEQAYMILFLFPTWWPEEINKMTLKKGFNVEAQSFNQKSALIGNLNKMVPLLVCKRKTLVDAWNFAEFMTRVLVKYKQNKLMSNSSSGDWAHQSDCVSENNMSIT